MASGYGVSSRGRGRNWKSEKPTMTPQYQNAKEASYNSDIQNLFGITQEPWKFNQTSTSDLNEPSINHFQFENDDELEEEEKVILQQTQAQKDVMTILSGTCSYFTDTDSLSSSTCGEVANEFFMPFYDPYNSLASVAAKHHKQAGAIGKSSTNFQTNNKQSAHSVKDNPVNKLEEVSKCKKLPAPSYEIVSRKQSVKGFVAVCELLDYVATGYGNSQDEAREEAAIKMLKNLQIEDDSPPEDDYGFERSFQCNITKEKDQNSLQDKTKNQCKAPHFQQSKFNLRGLEHCQREECHQKRDGGPHYPFPEFYLRPTGNKQYVWLLQSLASKMNFEVRYEIVPHRTSNSLAQCLVHLCKDPPVVCYGSAKSEYKAKSSAARCAFEYLKIVYQK